MVLLRMSPMPMVSRIWFWGSAFRTWLMTVFWRMAPKRKSSGKTKTIDTNGSTLPSVKRK